jgi:predicted membrane-bound mannosyltransferase
MPDAFRVAKARKKRTKWWREHNALAGIILVSAFAVVFLCIRFIDLRLPGWLTALGISPSGVNLLFGTAACAPLGGKRNWPYLGSLDC